LARLAASGDLDLIYAHLHSQRNFTPTAERIGRIVAPEAAAPSWEQTKKVAATTDG
jgi:hypothetical protein